MRGFLIIYTLAMIAGSALTLSLVPRTMKDVGKERERLEEALPGVSYERMVEAGYRFNTIVLLIEIIYYYLLISYAGSDWRLLYGGFFFGVMHVVYLVFSRLEKLRLLRDYTRSRAARLMALVTAVLTIAEVAYLALVLVLLFAA